MPDISQSVTMLEKHLAIPTSPYFLLLLVNGYVLRDPLPSLCWWVVPVGVEELKLRQAAHRKQRALLSDFDVHGN